MTARPLHPASWLDRLALATAGGGLGLALLLAAQVFRD
jgi:hypothetical protein